MIIPIVIIVKPNMSSGPDIPSEAGSTLNVSMDLIKTRDTKPAIPKVTDQLACVIAATEKMLESNAARIKFYSKCIMVR